jgi:hypothetical protein
MAMGHCGHNNVYSLFVFMVREDPYETLFTTRTFLSKHNRQISCSTVTGQQNSSQAGRQSKERIEAGDQWHSRYAFTLVFNWACTKGLLGIQTLPSLESERRRAVPMFAGYNWPGLETDPFSERLNDAGRLEGRRERPSAARETDTDTVAHTEGKERGVS